MILLISLVMLREHKYHEHIPWARGNSDMLGSITNGLYIDRVEVCELPYL